MFSLSSSAGNKISGYSLSILASKAARQSSDEVPEVHFAEKWVQGKPHGMQLKYSRYRSSAVIQYPDGRRIELLGDATSG